MMGHKIYFYEEIQIIILKLSLVLLIWSTENCCDFQLFKFSGHVQKRIWSDFVSKQVDWKFNLSLNFSNICSLAINIKYSGFSLTPYLESFTPTFGLGTPVFPRISSNLHCGIPTFSKRCLWDSYFQNPSENPGIDYVYNGLIFNVVIPYTCMYFSEI